MLTAGLLCALLCRRAQAIDLLWHTHQTLPCKYDRDTESCFGRFFDHAPFTEETPDSVRTKIAGDSTCLWDSAYRCSQPFLTYNRLPQGPLPEGVAFGDLLGRALSFLDVRDLLVCAEPVSKEFQLVCRSGASVDLVRREAALRENIAEREMAAERKREAEQKQREEEAAQQQHCCCQQTTSCFGEDTLVVLADGVSTARLKDLRIGDYLMTHTGTPAAVARIYSYSGRREDCVRLFGRFWITSAHPVFVGGAWLRPHELGEVAQFAGTVYNLELHGHADTCLCLPDGAGGPTAPGTGPVVACTLGKYCGGDYNIFTRKTVRCGGTCAQCDAVYMPEAPYKAGFTESDLALVFPPFPEDPDEQLPGRANNRQRPRL